MYAASVGPGVAMAGQGDGSAGFGDLADRLRGSCYEELRSSRPASSHCLAPKLDSNAGGGNLVSISTCVPTVSDEVSSPRYVSMSTLFDGHGIKLFDGLPATGSGRAVERV
jgi:hypothetical protein